MLSRLLGSLPSATAIGELSGVWDAAARGDLCSCGAVIVECPVWVSGFQAVKEEHGLTVGDFPEFARLSQSVLRTRRSRELKALQIQPSQQWPQDVQRYVAVVGTLLRAVSTAASSEILIDSSKLPPGLLTLALLDDVRLDVVHLVRDPRAVATSERRSLRRSAKAANSPPGRSLLRSSVYWSLSNVAVRRLGTYARSFTIVRYEDLATRPEETLGRLLRRMDVPAPVGPASLHPGHLAVGNPSRLAVPTTAIRPDMTWERELKSSERLLVVVVTLPARLLLSMSAHRSDMRA